MSDIIPKELDQPVTRLDPALGRLGPSQQLAGKEADVVHTDLQVVHILVHVVPEVSVDKQQLHHQPRMHDGRRVQRGPKYELNAPKQLNPLLHPHGKGHIVQAILTAPAPDALANVTPTPRVKQK